MKIKMLESMKPYLIEGVQYPVVNQNQTHLIIIDSKGSYHFISKSGVLNFRLIE
ncbi:hypothetical protein [Paenibacillus herberti]|uniref:hypothetical protein n=1 Tax=Paenibacillus herberti TaxID=1619309 RepID=UPI001595DA4F|nr:hypothetical protein [Paenibacillus herberti]